MRKYRLVEIGKKKRKKRKHAVKNPKVPKKDSKKKLSIWIFILLGIYMALYGLGYALYLTGYIMLGSGKYLKEKFGRTSEVLLVETK